MGVGASPPHAIFGSDAPRRDASSGADVLRAVHGPRRDLRGVVVRRAERRADRGRRLARRGPRRVLEPGQRVRRGRRAPRGPQRRGRPQREHRDADLALPGAGLAEDRQLPPLARGRRRDQQRQRHAGVLDGAPVQPVRRRLRRRRRELRRLHRVHRPRQPERPLRRRQPRPRGRARRRPRPVPQRRLRRLERHAVRGRERRAGLVSHVPGRGRAPGRQRPGLRLTPGGLAARRRPARGGAWRLVRRAPMSAAACKRP